MGATAHTYNAADWPAESRSRCRHASARSWQTGIGTLPSKPIRMVNLLTDAEDAVVAPVAPVPQHVRERVSHVHAGVRLHRHSARHELCPPTTSCPRWLNAISSKAPTKSNWVAIVSRRNPARAHLRRQRRRHRRTWSRATMLEADLYGLRPDQFQLIRQAERSLRGAGAAPDENGVANGILQSAPRAIRRWRWDHGASRRHRRGTRWTSEVETGREASRPDRSKQPWGRRARATQR